MQLRRAFAKRIEIEVYSYDDFANGKLAQSMDARCLEESTRDTLLQMIVSFFFHGSYETRASEGFLVSLMHAALDKDLRCYSPRWTMVLTYITACLTTGVLSRQSHAKQQFL